MTKEVKTPPDDSSEVINATEPEVSGANQSGDTDIHITDVPPTVLPPVNPNGGAIVGTSPVLQEMNGLHPESEQVNEEIFEEIPVEVCGQLYKTTLEVGFTLKNKGLPMRELPETRVKRRHKSYTGY